MLVLSRKEGQRVLIGDDIVVTLVRLGNGQATIGFDAPDHINIVREEIAQDGDGCSSDHRPPRTALPAELDTRSLEKLARQKSREKRLRGGLNGTDSGRYDRP